GMSQSSLELANFDRAPSGIFSARSTRGRGGRWEAALKAIAAPGPLAGPQVAPDAHRAGGGRPGRMSKVRSAAMPLRPSPPGGAEVEVQVARRLGGAERAGLVDGCGRPVATDAVRAESSGAEAREQHPGVGPRLAEQARRQLAEHAERRIACEGALEAAQDRDL